MKIVIRKKNSVTSIILFLFNLFEEIIGSSSIRLGILIETMMKFDKNETAIRMGLSRAVKSGILINKTIDNDVYYELTKEGSANIEAWNAGMKRFFQRYEQRNKNWNEQWYILTMLDFIKTNEDNGLVVEELKELGMAEINNNVWILPYSVSKEVAKLFSERNLTYFEIEGGIQSNRNVVDLINDVYDIKLIQKKYRDFIKSVKEVESMIEGLEKDLGSCLPILFELGWQYYDITTQDPALPTAILGNWEGDKAFTQFGELRGSLLDRLRPYFHDFV